MQAIRILSTYEAFGSAKCNVIRILSGVDADTCACFDSVRNEISRNQITLKSRLILRVSDLYRITLLPVYCKSAINDPTIETRVN